MPSDQDQNIKIMTVQEVADLKLEIWQDRFTRKEIAKDTYDGYMWRVKVLNRVFGRRLLCEISDKDILGYQSRILQEFSAATSNRSLFDSAWNAICKLAGFDDFHYHDLIHTFCSNLIMSGSDIKEAKDLIGHIDLSMTDRYSHLTLLHKKDCQDRLANHYGTTEKIAKQ